MKQMRSKKKIKIADLDQFAYVKQSVFVLVLDWNHFNIFFFLEIHNFHLHFFFRPMKSS